MRLAAALLLASACASPTYESPPVLGSPEDMRTRPGDYVGYRIVTTCAYDMTAGVIGQGSISVAVPAEVNAVGGELLRLVENEVASVWGGSGYALGCIPGASTTVFLDDWRDADRTIELIAAWLVERDLGLQVSVGVESQPVPIAN